MTKYYITHTRKDDEGDIIKVKTTHSEFTTGKVIEIIEGERDSFFVEDGTDEIPVNVIQGENKKYIRTVKDGKETNNLDNLPDFW